MARRNIETALSKGEVPQLRRANKIHIFPFLSIMANEARLAAVCIRQCIRLHRRRAATKANAPVNGGSFQTNASPRSRICALFSAWQRYAVRVIRLPPTTQPGKIYGTNGRNERVEMKNDVDERGIKAAPFSPLMMRYL